MKPECLTRETVKSQTAIVILAYADYESLELSLATHAKFTAESGLPIYILQNGRGTYDTERTLSVGKRYETLYPGIVKVITHIPPQKPYKAIRQLFHDPVFSKYQYVIKLDDDVMVLTPGWVDRLMDCYFRSYEEAGDDLAYVTSLVNNNPFGFKRLIENCGELSEEYFTCLARPHLVGRAADDAYNPYRIIPKETVFGGGFGTVWRLPYLARWLHEKTTMRPEYYIGISKEYGVTEVDARERYSINCMLFNKDLWDEIYSGSDDDEHMLHVYCMLNKKRIIADLSVPMVHLAFYSQRNEVRDMIPQIREVYTEFLNLPFPIAMCGDRMIEIENRLRFMEKNLTIKPLRLFGQKLKRTICSGIRCYREHGFRYTANRLLVHRH